MSHDCAGLPGDVHVHHQCDVEPRHATARPNARRCALRCPVIPVPKPPVVARLALECQMSSRVKPNACGLCLCCRKAASACCRADRARLWLDRRERCGSAAWTAAGSSLSLLHLLLRIWTTCSAFFVCFSAAWGLLFLSLSMRFFPCFCKPSCFSNMHSSNPSHLLSFRVQVCFWTF